MVPLKIEGRKNPMNPTADKLYYLRAVKRDYVDFDRLAYLIANQSTVREADCLAVLRALELNVIDQLMQGHIIQLGNLGNFQVGVRSEGTNTPENQHVRNVKTSHINYRPGKRIKEALKNLKFQLLKS
ncbi:MAG: HU family DNA-binding protein [Bacteroidota bacterium]